MSLDRKNKQSGDQINVNTPIDCSAGRYMSTTKSALRFAKRNDGMARKCYSPNL
jgi:hypothetical protein